MSNQEQKTKPTIFLDRDGVLNLDAGYVFQEDKLEIIESAISAMKSLSQSGYLLVVVTNQSGIARGYYEEEDVIRLHKIMDQRFMKNGVKITDWYFCPHHPEGIKPQYKKTCDCRKPANGMLRQATLDHNIDLPNSYMVGDKKSDIEAGLSMGVKTIQILDKYPKTSTAHYHTKSLKEALDFIPLDLKISTSANPSSSTKL